MVSWLIPARERVGVLGLLQLPSEGDFKIKTLTRGLKMVDRASEVRRRRSGEEWQQWERINNREGIARVTGGFGT